MRISDWSSDVCSSDLWISTLPQLWKHRRTIRFSTFNMRTRAYAHWNARRRKQAWHCQRPTCLCLGQRNSSEESTSELQSRMRISYAVFCLNKQKSTQTRTKEVALLATNKRRDN